MEMKKKRKTQQRSWQPDLNQHLRLRLFQRRLLCPGCGFAVDCWNLPTERDEKLSRVELVCCICRLGSMLMKVRSYWFVDSVFGKSTVVAAVWDWQHFFARVFCAPWAGTSADLDRSCLMVSQVVVRLEVEQRRRSVPRPRNSTSQRPASLLQVGPFHRREAVHSV